MKYNDLIQLHFEGTTALLSYWKLSVVLVGPIKATATQRHAILVAEPFP